MVESWPCGWVQVYDVQTSEGVKMENARKLNSFTVRLHASNEGRGSATPTIVVDVVATSVSTDNVEKLLDGFNALLNLVVEVQETVPSKV